MLIRPAKQAFTMIELAMAILLTSILMIGLSHMFSGGLKSSVKGSAHLNNIQTSSVLLGQLELDLKKTSDIIFPASEEGDSNEHIKLEVLEEGSSGGLATGSVMYSLDAGGEGVKRMQDFSGNTSEHTFCRGLKVNLGFRRLELSSGQLGLMIKLRTKNPRGPEEFTMERFILCEGVKKGDSPTGWHW